jgi:mono/diheme cytochrome c family protein
VPPRRNRPKPIVAAGEVLVWLLFALLLAPAGFAGWAIGHYTGHQSGTVTVTVGASSTPATTTAAAPTTTTNAHTTTAAAASAAGKAVFLSAGCGACHTFKAAGASGTIGPDLDTAPAADAKKANMALAAFVRESIVKPEAYIAPGFPKGVMPQTFGTSLSKAQLDALVSFITGGK